MQEGSLTSTPSLELIVCRVFDDGHSVWCEVIPHCSFDLHFSNSDVEHLFMFVQFSSVAQWCLTL